MSPSVFHEVFASPLYSTQYAEMCLSHAMLGNESNLHENGREPVEAAKKKSTSVPYKIAVGRLLILRKQYERAHDYLSTAVKEEVEVSSIFVGITFVYIYIVTLA